MRGGHALPKLPRVIATRFAPSPTGPLHLGHLYSALMAHDCARQQGGAFRVRLDDLDTGRVRPAFADAIVADLEWAGLMPDGVVRIQSQHVADYAAALDRLRDMGVIYPCFCTRADIAAEIAGAASAPHGFDGPIYPGTCRGRDRAQVAEWMAEGRAHALRLDMVAAVDRAGQLRWFDDAGAAHDAQPGQHGDIVMLRRDGAFAYHLASTIDDAAMDIGHVVRGRDLTAATDVHRLLQALLDLPTPVYVHHRLIGDACGRRLAKRDDSASIASLRDAGADPARLLADLRAGRLPHGYRWVD